MKDEQSHCDVTTWFVDYCLETLSIKDDRPA